MSNIAYLSLGTNIKPEQNMKAALTTLAQQTKVVAISSVWETKAVGTTAQANYLNAAVMVETDLNAQQLKEQVLGPIEHNLGRVRQVDKNAPRPMDIDIMLFNQDIIDLGSRHIPDAEILERPFVAIPLAEIAPDYIHPETGQSLADIVRTFAINPHKMKPYPNIFRNFKPKRSHLGLSG